jgi:diaminohydroxyphosphoribosylaminopyrimidine deaminase / 5-amino-6-(5-phosphoribosylamino)uracil reductase
MSASHETYLAEALAAARTRKGECSPNPAVGAVVVKDGQLLSVGAHWGAGFPHAEVQALEPLGEAARGADLYVTLEPCCHWGRTPPCTKLIKGRGLKRIFYGFTDPNPKVSGRGAAELIRDGLECTHIESAAIDEFYRSYRHWTLTGKPWVTAKLALSLDGKIAGAEGAPYALTGEELNQFTHRKRGESDALMTTFRTIQKDNPRLNVRTETHVRTKPVYVLDRRLETDPKAILFSTARTLTFFHSEPNADRKERLEAKGARCVCVESLKGQLSWEAVLSQIGKDGVQDLWVEAGGRCFESLVEAKAIQQAYLYLTLHWLGPSAQAAFSEGSELFKTAHSFHWRGYGRDALCEMRWENR